jgi:hypothetical protein
MFKHPVLRLCRGRSIFNHPVLRLAEVGNGKVGRGLGVVPIVILSQIPLSHTIVSGDYVTVGLTWMNDVDTLANSATPPLINFPNFCCSIKNFIKKQF